MSLFQRKGMICKTNINKPKVTVLMSVYEEKPEYLLEAIKSIIGQSYSDFEFVIIDDGCGEPCSRILDEYARKDNRIKIFHNEKNIGLTKSLNRGLDIAKGEYIARMDSDDSSLSNRLMVQVKYMEQHPTVAVVGSNICDFHDKKIRGIRYSNNDEVTAVRLLFFNAGVSHPTSLIRKNFLEANGIRYDERYMRSQDYKLWIDILMHHGCIRTLREPLVRYRKHPSQISIKFEGQQSADAMQIKKTYFQLVFGNLVAENDYEMFCFLSEMEAPQNIRKEIIALKRIMESNKSFNKKYLKQELLMRWLMRGKHLRANGYKVSGKYYVNTFALSVLQPLNLLYAFKSFIIEKYI